MLHRLRNWLFPEIAEIIALRTVLADVATRQADLERRLERRVSNQRELLTAQRDLTEVQTILGTALPRLAAVEKRLENHLCRPTNKRRKR